jgi:hypothetical protein
LERGPELGITLPVKPPAPELPPIGSRWRAVDMLAVREIFEVVAKPAEMIADDSTVLLRGDGGMMVLQPVDKFDGVLVRVETCIDAGRPIVVDVPRDAVIVGAPTALHTADDLAKYLGITQEDARRIWQPCDAPTRVHQVDARADGKGPHDSGCVHCKSSRWIAVGGAWKCLDCGCVWNRLCYEAEPPTGGSIAVDVSSAVPRTRYRIGAREVTKQEYDNHNRAASKVLVDAAVASPPPGVHQRAWRAALMALEEHGHGRERCLADTDIDAASALLQVYERERGR